MKRGTVTLNKYADDLDYQTPYYSVIGHNSVYALSPHELPAFIKCSKLDLYLQ